VKSGDVNEEDLETIKKIIGSGAVGGEHFRQYPTTRLSANTHNHHNSNSNNDHNN
jgi:hypothetical protein